MCCPNRPVYAQELEAAVWRAVRRLLEHPDRLAAEYRRRLAGRGARPAPDGLPAQLDRAKRGLARLIDGYAEGLLTKDEFVPRLDRLRLRVAAPEAQAVQDRADQVTEAELRLAVGRLEEFAGAVRKRLAGADRATQRELILALVRRVEVDAQRVRVVFKVGPSPPGFDQRRSQHRPGRAGRLALVARVPPSAGRHRRRDARGRLTEPSRSAPDQRFHTFSSIVSHVSRGAPLTSSLVSSGGRGALRWAEGSRGLRPRRGVKPRAARLLRCAPPLRVTPRPRGGGHGWFAREPARSIVCR